MREHTIAVIPGDGIGPEVTDAALDVVHRAADVFGFTINPTPFPLSARHYLQTGELWNDEVASALREHDAILFGALGDPSVPPGVLERGVILAMRTAFRQAVNLRPVKLYRGVDSPLKNATPDTCDLVVVRENTEGAYIGRGSTVHADEPHTVAIQESINTRPTIEAAVDFSFQLAQYRNKHLTLCHKKNVLVEAGNLWQRTVDEVAARYPDVQTDYVHVDAMCFYLVTTPERFDVVVTDNLFGDIITDLGAAVQGGMGVAASANLNITGTAPSMFEPIHGSAPDIAGKGLANPVGAVLSAAMCLATLGETRAAHAIEDACAEVLATHTTGKVIRAEQIGERLVDHTHDGHQTRGTAKGSDEARNDHSLLDFLATLPAS